MISQRGFKPRKTAFDIKSIIGSCDRKHETSEEDKQRQDQGWFRSGAVIKRRIDNESDSMPFHNRICTNMPNEKCFEPGNCHAKNCYSLCHAAERDWLKKISADQQALESPHPMPLPVFHGMPSLPMHGETCEQQNCLESRNQSPRSFPRISQSLLNARLTKAHQYMNAAEKCRFFQSFAPQIAQDLHSQYVMQAGLLPPFSAAYARPDLLASHHGSRRIRTTFTRSQLKVLEKRFKSSHYIVGDERKQLAQELGLNESQVKIWFQNRRTKYKQDKEFEELGKSKIAKRKGEHHVRKWQIETRTNETLGSSDSEEAESYSPSHADKNVTNEI